MKTKRAHLNRREREDALDEDTGEVVPRASKQGTRSKDYFNSAVQLEIGHLEQQMIIDKDGLDECLVQQPVLYSKVSQEYAVAVSRRDEQKDRVKQVEAHLSLQFRQDTLVKGEKATEKTIEAMVLTSDERTRAVAKYNASTLELEMWQALKEAYQQRAYALKDLAGLYVAGYFGSAAVHGNAARTMQERDANVAKVAMNEARRNRDNREGRK